MLCNRVFSSGTQKNTRLKSNGPPLPPTQCAVLRLYLSRLGSSYHCVICIYYGVVKHAGPTAGSQNQKTDFLPH